MQMRRVYKWSGAAGGGGSVSGLELQMESEVEAKRKEWLGVLSLFILHSRQLPSLCS